MRFTKVKYNGKKVELSWAEGDDANETDVHLSSSDIPHPDLVNALQAFRSDVLRILEVEDAWGHEVRVIGVSINEEKDGRSGLVITSLRSVSAANAPVVVNTPHLREALDAIESNAPGFMSSSMGVFLDRLRGEAERFMHGKRAQSDMFTQAADRAEAELATAAADA